MNSGEDERKHGTSMTDVEKTMSAIEGVVRILGPLDSDERQTVIQGALVILREKLAGAPTSRSSEGTSAGEEAGNVHARARLWMKQNDVTTEQLSHVFDISDGAAVVIASGVSGKNNTEKTIKAYALTGTASLLSSGEPVFDDKSARSLCESLGCYDSTNHSKYMKEMGNNFVGSKDKGWKLTAPGLKFAATVVKELAQG